MIAKLTGLVDLLMDGWLILNVGGVGYRVFCSNRTLSKMPSRGEAAQLYIETQVREDHIHLFGFADAAEKEWFSVLTNVQGVGAKVGLAILSALSPEELSMALATGDAKAFTRASGVGPKLAQRIVSELKGKTPFVNSIGMLDSPAGVSHIINNVMEEAISALTNLGYGRSEAGVVIASIYKEHTDIGTSELIRLSLKEIGQNHG